LISKGKRTFLWTCETGAQWSSVLWNQTWIENLQDHKNNLALVKTWYRDPCVLSALFKMTLLTLILTGEIHKGGFMIDSKPKIFLLEVTLLILFENCWCTVLWSFFQPWSNSNPFNFNKMISLPWKPNCWQTLLCCLLTAWEFSTKSHCRENGQTQSYLFQFYLLLHTLFARRKHGIGDPVWSDNFSSNSSFHLTTASKVSPLKF